MSRSLLNPGARAETVFFLFFFHRHLFTTNYASELLTRSQLISILPDKMLNKLLLPGNKCNCGPRRWSGVSGKQVQTEMFGGFVFFSSFRFKKKKRKATDPFNVTVFINKKTLGHPSSGERWCETNTNTAFFFFFL